LNIALLNGILAMGNRLIILSQIELSSVRGEEATSTKGAAMYDRLFIKRVKTKLMI